MVMALCRSLFTISLLLFSLLIPASAGDYSYSPKSQGDQTKSQDYKYPSYPALDKSKSEDKSKNEGYSYNSKSYDEKSEQEYHGSTHKLDVENSKLKEKSKQTDYGYVSKEVEEKSKHEDDHSYTFEMEHHESKSKDQDYTQHGHNSDSQSYDYMSKSKDNSYDSKSEGNGDEKSKSDDHDYTPQSYASNSKSKSTSEGNGYEHKEDSYKSKSKSVEYNAYDSKSVKEEKSMSVTVEGLVYCKSGSRYYPIRGAVARVTCVSVDEHGYEGVPLTVYSEASDEKGYFSVCLSSSLRTYDYKFTECKAYLEKSALKYCDVPTDVNNGISGASLNSYRILKDKKTKLYSLRTFYYASESETVSETKAPAPTPTGY